MKWLQKFSNPFISEQRATQPGPTLIRNFGYGLGFIVGSYDGIQNKMMSTSHLADEIYVWIVLD
jgi:hypothetical protein